MLDAVERHVDRPLRQPVDGGVARAARRVHARQVDDELERAAAGERQAQNLLAGDRRRRRSTTGSDDFRAGRYVDLFGHAADFELHVHARRHAGAQLDRRSTVAVLKPVSVTVTEYLPGVQGGDRELPVGVGDAPRTCRPVAAFLTRTLAPGITGAARIGHGPVDGRRGPALGEGRGGRERPGPRRARRATTNSLRPARRHELLLARHGAPDARMLPN